MKIRHVDFSPDEWMGGTIELDNAERGLYITACALIYSSGGPISRERLRAACRDHGHAFKRQLTRLVELGKLMINDGQISNKRSINELQKAEERSIKAQQNGLKGGRPRKENNEITKPDGLLAEKLTINHQPSTINHHKNISSKLRSDVTDEGFLKFYEVYPRHEARRAAERAWKAALKRAPPETIIAGAKRYAGQRSGQDKQYTKLPASWLNADCWTDESGSINGHAQPTGPTGPRPSLKELLGDDYERAMALAH